MHPRLLNIVSREYQRGDAYHHSPDNYAVSGNGTWEI